MSARRISFAEYLAIDAVNFSTLRHMGSSALHYHHAATTPGSDSETFRIGRSTHTAVLEPDRFALDYAVYDGPRTGEGSRNALKAFKAANAQRTIISDEQYAECLAMRDAVRANPIAASYLLDGLAEQVLTTFDKATGLNLKCRVDWISRSRRALVDLKTARSIDSREFGNAAARYGYHIQGAFYHDVHAAVSGEDDWTSVIIAVEKTPPYDVGVFVLDPEEALYAGREVYRELLTKVAECKSVNVWPGRYGREANLALPAYVFDPDPDGIADGIQLEAP